MDIEGLYINSITLYVKNNLVENLNKKISIFLDAIQL